MLLGKALEQAPPRSLTHPATPVGISRQGFEGGAQRGDVTRRHEQALDAVAHEVPVARHVGDNERSSRGRRLQQGARQAFAAARGQHEHIRALPDRGDIGHGSIPVGPGPLAPGQDLLRRDGFGVFAIAAAIKVETQADTVGQQPFVGLHEKIDPLRPDHAADMGGDGHGVVGGRQRREGVRVDAGATENGKARSEVGRNFAHHGKVVWVFHQKLRVWLAHEGGQHPQHAEAIKAQKWIGRNARQTLSRDVDDHMRHGDQAQGQAAQHNRLHGDQVHDVGPLAFDEARQLKGYLRRQGLVVGAAAKIELQGARAQGLDLSQPARRARDDDHGCRDLREERNQRAKMR